MILFVLPAETIYDRQHRVMGWRATPCARESLKTLRGIVPRLRELGAARVIFSDLDTDSGRLLAKKLSVPHEEWSALRRFNAGKSHGISREQWAKLRDEMALTWMNKPDVPVKGGDSYTSFNKRVAALKDKLKTLPDKTVVVAPEEIITAALVTTAKLERGRVYAWEARS